jgi:hypothetical protein
MTRFIKRRKEIKLPKKRQQKEKSAINLKENSSQIKDKNRTKSSCLICGKDATGALPLDIDLPKFPFCKAHDFDVQMYVFMFLGGKEQDAESWLKFAKEYATKLSKNKKSPVKKRE